jgi:hypothetical protein
VNISTYSAPNTIRVIKSKMTRWAGQVENMGQKRNTCGILVSKTEGKKPLEREAQMGVRQY